MDALILLGLFVGLFIAMPLLIGALRRTGWFWLPAALLFAFGALSISSIEPSHGEEAAFSALGDAIAYLFGMAMFAYAALAFLIGAVSFARHQKRERLAREKLLPQPLPVATIVSG